MLAQRGIVTTRTAALRLTPEQQLEREFKIQDLAAEFGVTSTPGNPRRQWVVQQVDARLAQTPRAGSGGGGSGSGNRLTIEYAYQNGYLKDIRDADNNQTAIWEATQINQFGQITEADLGNGVTTGYSFDANTGELTAIQSGKTGVSEIQDLSYQWDDLGNLIERQDHNINKTEEFEYDGLNRLHKAHLNTSQVLQMGYAANGNINSKTGTGTYDTSSSYNYTANTHKLSSIAGVSGSFTYDARGNMKTGMGRTITYSSYNKPTFIDGGSNESTFKYGPERSRYFHQREFGSNISTILYAGGLFQKVTRADSVVEFRHAIQANGQEVATLIRRDDFDHEMLYHHRDHLGSVTTITDENGTVVEELSYDAFGKRRDATDWSSDLTSTIREDLNEQYDRGYTGHEQLDNLELVHMNGRVYDPSIGRFLSADPFVPQPFVPQSYNRFSYLNNNPLNATDPSGFMHHDDDDINDPPPDGGCMGGICIRFNFGDYVVGGTFGYLLEVGLGDGIRFSITHGPGFWEAYQAAIDRLNNWVPPAPPPADPSPELPQQPGLFVSATADLFPPNYICGLDYVKPFYDGPDDRIIPAWFRGFRLEYRSVIDGPAPTAERSGRQLRHDLDLTVEVATFGVLTVAPATRAAKPAASAGSTWLARLFSRRAPSAAGHAGAAAAGVSFRQIAGTRGLKHSFDKHAAQWFGRRVPASTHLRQWQLLVERAAGSNLQVSWSLRADATVGHLARIDGKYFFAQFYVGGPRAGELASAFVPSQRALSAILGKLK